jgi:hypothetical protein
MRKLLLPAALFVAAQLGAQQSFCFTTEMQNKWFAEHPELKQNFDQLQQKAAEADKVLFQNNYQQLAAKSSVTSFTIPVVFHILHNGGGENISDAQVQDAVAILNRDFNRANPDTSDVVAAFKNQIGNPKINFVLAKKDVNGNCTNGILRHWDTNTDWNSNFNNYKYTWPSNRYLNIYVVKTIGSGAAGYTYLPGSGIPNSVDAIVILSTYVGSIGTGNPGTARALTHEVGHWFDLPHTWGGTNQPGVACGDDGVGDTPETKGFTYCNLNNAVICNPGVVENMQNYMDYAYCQRMFTIGQATRMNNALNSSTNSRNNLSSPSNLAFTGALSPAGVCPPQLDITVAGNYTVCAGKSLPVKSFTSVGTPTSYVWSASDGANVTNSGLPNTSVVFQQPGTTTITCVAGNAAGSVSSSIVVTVMEPWAQISTGISESFENLPGTTPANWSIINPASQSWKTTTLSASQGKTSMYVKGESMGVNAVTILETPSFDFKNNPGALFTFKYAYRKNTVNNKDIFSVQASADCGGTWQDIYAPSNNVLAQNSGGISSDVFVPSASEWKLYDQLVAHPKFYPFTLEPNVRIRFYFKENVDGTNGGNRFYLDEVNFSTPVGINELTKEVGLNVYPNPSSSAFNVAFTLANTSKVGYRVYTVSGAEVAGQSATEFSAGSHNVVVNGDRHLAPGIYFLNLEINGAVMSRKLVVE